jgi:hypothetical protein
MRILISAEGQHEPEWHYMRIDSHGLLVDLDGIRHSSVDPGSLTDPTIIRVEWGPVIKNGEMAAEAGTITRQDGQPADVLRP